MDDAINTSSFRQPNTFMDVMAPNKSPRRGEPNRSNTLMRSAVKKPQPTISDQQQPDIQTSFNTSDHSEAASLSAPSPFISRLSPTIYEDSVEETQVPVESVADQYPSMEQDLEQDELGPEIEAGSFGVAEAAIPAPSFNVFNPAVPKIDTSFVESTGDTLKQGVRKLFSGWSVLGVAVIGLIASVI